LISLLDRVSARNYGDQGSWHWRQPALVWALLTLKGNEKKIVQTPLPTGIRFGLRD
jgi:hypothetical protein